MNHDLYTYGPSRRPPVLSPYDSALDGMKKLDEHWLVYPMGDYTPAMRRGKRFALEDVAGVKAYYAAAVAVGYEPKVTLFRKVLSPSSGIPKRYETLTHIDRVGTDVSGDRRYLINRPTSWPTYRTVHVSLGGERLRLYNPSLQAPRRYIKEVLYAVRCVQPFADLTVDVAEGAPTHIYSVIRENGTEGTHDDPEVREVVGKALIYVLWEFEDRLLRKTLPDVRRR